MRCAVADIEGRVRCSIRRYAVATNCDALLRPRAPVALGGVVPRQLIKVPPHVIARAAGKVPAEAAAALQAAKPEIDAGPSLLAHLFKQRGFAEGWRLWKERPALARDPHFVAKNFQADRADQPMLLRKMPERPDSLDFVPLRTKRETGGLDFSTAYNAKARRLLRGNPEEWQRYLESLTKVP